MGIGRLIEEVAGAVAAEKAVEAVKPDAGMFTKTAAAIAGFEGVKTVAEKIEDRSDDKSQDTTDDTSQN